MIDSGDERKTEEVELPQLSTDKTIIVSSPGASETAGLLSTTDQSPPSSCVSDYAFQSKDRDKVSNKDKESGAVLRQRQAASSSSSVVKEDANEILICDTSMFPEDKGQEQLLQVVGFMWATTLSML